MGRGGRILALAALVLAASGGAARGEGSRCVISMFTTCSNLTPNYYPADTINWFHPSLQSQIVFFVQMMFPLRPGMEDKNPSLDLEWPWHPPLAVPPLDSNPAQALSIAISDHHFAEAEWRAPDGQVIADLGLTMTPRVSTDYLTIDGMQMIPHTFAMAIGTKDIRKVAGQTALPSQVGLYHIRFWVDGKLEGVAFFSILEEGKTPVQGEPGRVEGEEKLAPFPVSPTGIPLRGGALPASPGTQAPAALGSILEKTLGAGVTGGY